MRAESVVRKALRAATLGGLAAAMVALAGCSSLPFIGGKPSIRLVMDAAPLANSCGRSSGLPLTIRVLQVSDASALSGITLDRLWDREEKVLGNALLSHSDVVVDPGTRKEASLDRVAQAKTAVVVGNFCKTEGSCWYLIKPLKGGSATIKLALDSACLHETKH